MTCSGFKNTRTFIQTFKDDVRGSMTVFGLFFFLFSGILGAIALDVTSLYASRTHLQVAADQAAHAALYNLTVVGKDDVQSKLAAIEIVQATLPLGKHGVTITPDDIEFGDFDDATGTFLADEDGVGAVRVQTSFSDLNANPASAYLFRLLGLDSFEIYASATFAIYAPGCLNEGFVANGIVDMQNHNVFGAGFCIHSNTEVQLQTNNEFKPGATVSMPGGRATVVVPGDKVDDVEGLAAALVDDELDLRVLSRIENMVYQYQNPTGTDFPNPGVSGDEIGWPSYITNRTPRHMGIVGEIDSATLTPGGVYFVNCSNENKGLTINSGNGPSVEEPVEVVTTTGNGKGRSKGNGNGNGNGNGGDSGGGTSPLPVLSEVIVITPCPVTFGQGSNVQNARIISLSDSSKSFSGSSGVSLGSLDADGCEENGAQLVTMGDMHFAANFAAYGSQIFSLGNIKFAATPGAPIDFKGISVVADGEIDMTSHVSAQAGCNPGGSGEAITASYFRMVR